jgi:membrane fusion protein, multidrug efflux system
LLQVEECIVVTTANPVTATCRRSCAALFPLVAALLLTACQEETRVEAPPARPVRTVVVEKSKLGEVVALTGQIQAENEATLSFRIAGRIIERSVGVGDQVALDQVLAKLDPQNELNALRSAEANLSAAQARLQEASNNFTRQQTLLERGFTTRVLFDQAEQNYRTAQSQLDDAKAQLKTAEDRVSYTELKADAAGTIIARSAETGEVVQAGQMIFQVARKGGWDAIFDVPAQVLRSAPPEPKIDIALTDAPSVRAVGRVRQVDPQADPITRTFRVRVSIADPPAAMRLGATVVGRMQMDSTPVISIPATALTEFERQPSVWVVDKSNLTVSMRKVGVARFDQGTVEISDGLDTGDVVVTAGIQALHPGQKVRLLGSSL